MSTDQVPGHKPENYDELHAGCWAEHRDGTLIYVLAAEGKTVYFHVFDLSLEPPRDYRTSMNLVAFQKQFSWVEGDDKSKDRWTWHDKTPFDWSRIIKEGVREEARPSDVRGEMSAAARTLESLTKLGLTVEDNPIDPAKLRHLADVKSRPSAKAMIASLQAAIDACPEDDRAAVQAEVAQAIAKPVATTKVKKGLLKRLFGRK